MNKLQWNEFCENNYIVLDGATGSNLMKAGMPVGVCPEKWILEHPQALIDLQKSYVEAGSNIVYAPTFTANKIKLQEYGLYEEQESIINGLVSLSKQAVENKALIAGDLTMTGQQLAPIGTMQLEELIDVYKEQIQYLVKAGVDLLVVETMMSLAEARAAVIAAKETCDLPVLVTMTFEANGRTLFGTDAKTAAIVLSSLGVDAIGVNCSTGPLAMAQIIREMAEVTSIPLIAKPNAGLPVTTADGKTVYDMQPDTFACEVKALIDAGAIILGGCCGTSPEYIKGIVSVLPKSKRVASTTNSSAKMRYLSSERKSLAFSLDSQFIVVGERINPTGKKKLQESLRNGDLDMVLNFAEEQENSGAEVLDINLGMSGIDEKEMMLRVLDELPNVTNLPLSLDSSNIEVLEAALRHYPGRALVNSVSYEPEKIQKLLPLIKKYGAMFILLPLSDKGLPENLDAKHEIIDFICKEAYKIGLSKEDIVVDGLVTTVGANKIAGIEALETIKYCKAQGLATICGLSNISFGLPDRISINSTFLSLAIQAGLTMAIANPNQEQLIKSALAADLLLGKEGADNRYVEYISSLGDTPSQEQKQTVSTEPNTLQLLKDGVLKGNRKGITALVEKGLSEGISAQKMLEKALLPAITLVGDYFDKKKYFLPQLIASAETMKNAIQILEPLLMKENTGAEMAKVVMATVEGDIHDIGKNLVVMMLKNHGYQVIDLGKDVAAETIVKCAEENHAKVIGLSALMTTTMQKMKEVVDLVKENGLNCKVMIGGAVITSDFAQEIHADAYASDASDAVKVVKRLLEI